MAKKTNEIVVEGAGQPTRRIITPIDGFADVATLRDKLNEVIARINS